MRPRTFLRLVLALAFAAAFAAAAPANEVLDKFDRALAAYKARDFEAAHAIVRPMAEAGHAGAQHLLGEIFIKSGTLFPPFSDRRSDQDQNSEALREKIFTDQAYAGLNWIQKAAEQNLAAAQVRMGELHRRIAINESIRVGGAPDFTKAIFWFRRAAMQGNRIAMGWMAIAHTTYGEFLVGPPVEGTDEAEIWMWSILVDAYRPWGMCTTSSELPPVDLPEPCSDDGDTYCGYTVADMKEAVRRAREWEPLFPELQVTPYPPLLDRLLARFRNLPDQ
jgi:TPR repeat protein